MERRRRLGVAALLLGAALLAPTTGCFSTRYTFGDGPRGGEVREHHTWYAFWGFVPLNAMDSRDLVGPADHYRVRAGFRGLNVFFNVFTGPLGFFRTTTLIEK